jgi:hypothetical protein
MGIQIVLTSILILIISAIFINMLGAYEESKGTNVSDSVRMPLLVIFFGSIAVLVVGLLMNIWS